MIGRPVLVGPRTVHDRLMARTVQRGECVEWTGYRMPNGYGSINIGHGLMRLTHRIAFELYVDRIPEGMYVCHHCDNPACIRPDHLFLGTPADNLADMRTKNRGYKPSERTHCLRGHAFSEDNTIVIQRNGAVVQRMCRACRQSANRRETERRRAARHTQQVAA